jgi:hypothetical protein
MSKDALCEDEKLSLGQISLNVDSASDFSVSLTRCSTNFSVNILYSAIYFSPKRSGDVILLKLSTVPDMSDDAVSESLAEKQRRSGASVSLVVLF